MRCRTARPSGCFRSSASARLPRLVPRKNRLSPVQARRKLAQHVALRRFDLDHVGAEIGQQRAAIGPGEIAAQIENLDPVERPGWFVRHHRPSRARIAATFSNTRCARYTIGIVDEFAVELDCRASLGFGLGERGGDAFGKRDFGIARREYAVHDRDLVGMDAHLALEAVSQCGAGRSFQALRVGQIDPDRVERRVDPGRARRGDDNRAGVGKLGLARGSRPCSRRA